MTLIDFFVFITFSIQSLLMLLDEFYFHRRREVPKFERIGHPIDTLTVLLCFGLVKFFPLNLNTVVIYVLFSIISCLCVIKDESVHKKYCLHFELYLHALLFLIHPIILFDIFLCWTSVNKTDFLSFSFQSNFLRFFFLTQFVLTFCFFIYQILYWNFISKSHLENIFYEKSRSS